MEEDKPAGDGVARECGDTRYSAGRRERSHETDDPGTEAMRRAWTIAAPAAFISALRNAAKARGVTLSVQSAKKTTLKHLSCGYINDPGTSSRSFLIKCASCHQTYDQDANAASILADLAGSEEPS